MTEKNWWSIVGGIILLQFAVWPLAMNQYVSWGHWVIAGLGLAAATIVIKLGTMDGGSSQASNRAAGDQCRS